MNAASSYIDQSIALGVQGLYLFHSLMQQISLSRCQNALMFAEATDFESLFRISQSRTPQRPRARHIQSEKKLPLLNYTQDLQLADQYNAQFIGV
jgi:hypothetical protein